MKKEIKEKELLDVTGGIRSHIEPASDAIRINCEQIKSKDECKEYEGCAWTNDKCNERTEGGSKDTRIR